MSSILDEGKALSGAAGEAGEDTMKGRYLTFPIQNESYGLEISYVKQIIGIQKMTEVPEMPYFMKGIINLRGVIIPLIDMRLRFGKPEREYDDRTCIIIVDVSGMRLGLITDSVSEVATIAEEDIEPLPGFNSARGYIKGIGKTAGGVVLIIDCEKLLSESELESINLPQ
jgi:purine-binding chemotaxis protein CheW